MTVNTLLDYGPLQLLIGKWVGNSGDDRSPEPGNVEINAYRETIVYEGIRQVSNAEEQHLAVLFYRQVVHRIRDNKQIHDQCGYWMWDAENDAILHSFTIPRGLTALAGGNYKKDGQQIILSVSASADHPRWAITQAPFLASKAKSKAFTQELVVCGDKMSYEQTTIVDIYEKKQFEHTDCNTLTRQY